MSEFLDTAFEELAEYEKKIVEENEAAKKLITSQSKRYKYVEYDNLKIKVKASIPFEVREKANKLKLEQENTEEAPENIIESQKPMYELLASVCLDEPFTDWRFWYVIDKKTGGVPTILREILNTISTSEKQTTRFR